MKKLLFAIITLSSINSLAQEKNYALTEVKKENGLYIFDDCEPYNKYTVIKEVSGAKGFWKDLNNLNEKDRREKMIRKALKERTDDTQAIILSYNSGKDRVYLIKFEENN